MDLFHSRDPAARRGRIRNLNEMHDASATFGDRLADRVAAWGGSWGFIIAFGVVLVVWTLGNTVILREHAFDEYPYIFLNLVLSMLAAIQAPIIMMSQNRSAARDRQAAQLDYEINLKAEHEIVAIHERMDREIVGLHLKINRLLAQQGIDCSEIDAAMRQVKTALATGETTASAG